MGVPPRDTALEPCVPVLRVFTDDVTICSVEGLRSSYQAARLPLLSLSFDYGGRIVRAGDEEGERDLGAESAARRLLESFGVVDLACVDDVATAADADYLVRRDENVHDYCAFMAYAVPQLRALGWRVEVDDAHEYRTVEQEPAWLGTIEPDDERPDWFGMQLGVEIDGTYVDLLPALVELLQKTGEGQSMRDVAKRVARCVALPVGERLYLTIPAERLRSIVRVLAELYDGKRGALVFPKLRGSSLASLDEIFKADDARIEWRGPAASLVAEGAALAGATKADAEMPLALRAQLRPYQIEGLAWMQQLRMRGAGGILADDMGLGKTLQTIAFLAVEKERRRLTSPALVVAPTSLMHTWQREMRKFAPHLRVVAVHGAKRHEAWEQVDRADVVVTSYPILCRDQDRFEKGAFSVVILDEAQTIKNLRSRVHQAVRTLDAPQRICLTGTPIENHLGELWAIVDFLNPGLLGDELHFGRFFRVPIERLGDEERLETLRSLLAPFVLRRTKSAVATELPPKTELMRPVELRGKQRELYESIRLAAHADVRKVIKSKGLAAATIPILGALTRLRQVCCDPRLSDLGRGVRESAKYDALMEMLAQQLEEKHRVLVFSQFTSMLSLIAAGLDERKVRYAVLTGDTTDRQAEVDAFESGQRDVFLISLKAGGTGLTLTSADTIIHYDPWWNPAVHAQATDRAYRIGQTKPVFVHNLFVAGSVEERMLRLQKRKRQVADALLAGAQPAAVLTEEEVETLFAPLT
jgi:superfamily II DNA or RNA helicase